MIVNWEGTDYTFELEKIRVSQAKVIKSATGFTMMTLEEGLDTCDPDALKAIFWLMKVQNGEAAMIDRIDFEILSFAKALQAAAEKQAKEEAAAKEAAEEAGTAEAPKDPA